MKVTYLNHSGFLLEWANSYWIFDYFKGEIPLLNPQKEIFVFNSHSHGDHFNPDIFEYLTQYSSVTYIFSDEIHDAFKQLRSKTSLPQVHFLKTGTDTAFHTSAGELLHVHTLRSTDLGCAFFIQYNGKNIYHAGDLHWWYWEGEDAGWNNQITEDYKKEMQYLNGKNIDLAFTLLDPRQEKDYALGMNYFLEHTYTKHVFPMHFWDDFSVINRYLQEYSVPDETSFYILQQNGQTFEIML